ncbi:MAG: hypothetical protein QE284_17280 [Rhizobium sp.]|nr:hypothetical protein [Rhizobium sp.]
MAKKRDNIKHSATTCASNKIEPAGGAKYVLTDSDREMIRPQIESLSFTQFTKLATGYPVGPDHPSRFLGQGLIAKSLGITDLTLYGGALSQLIAVTSGTTETDIENLNIAVSIVRAIEPRNQLETILALQMAAVHIASMKFTRRMNIAENLAQLEIYERTANKLMRTFTSQMEALRKHRNDGGQTVVVKHVHVHEGGQAIVGNVSQGGGKSTKSQPIP